MLDRNVEKVSFFSRKVGFKVVVVQMTNKILIVVIIPGLAFPFVLLLSLLLIQLPAHVGFLTFLLFWIFLRC